MEPKSNLPLAMLRRALSAQLIELEQLHEVAEKAWRADPRREADLTVAAHMSLAIDHLRHGNALVGKLLAEVLTDADREQAAEAGRRA
jgi:hypothetical protein